jgi:hypothetical protein
MADENKRQQVYNPTTVALETDAPTAEDLADEIGKALREQGPHLIEMVV